LPSFLIAGYNAPWFLKRYLLVRRLFILLALLFLGVTNANAFSLLSTQNNLESSILARAEGLNPNVLRLALNAYGRLYQEGYDKQKMLTIIDYSRPSTERRLWVIDLKNLQVPFYELVAHGKNSGENMSNRFSDNPQSLASSIGVFLTGNTYMGKHGYSLRLQGLEAGFNDKAYAREIVLHAASYVSEAFARAHGRLGRSFGCPAVDATVSTPIINNIKQGTVLFAYYPDKAWLTHSTYLKA
jgi:hypothetical protein